MNIVSVKVNGIEYNLKGDEKEEYLHKVAGYVDKKIKILFGNNKNLNTADASVLVAINVADELFKCDSYVEGLENKNLILDQNQKSLKETVDALKAQIKNMDRLNNELESKIKDLKSDDLVNKYISVKEQNDILADETKRYKKENEVLLSSTKELKLITQSSKFKVRELENKFLESQIIVATLKNEMNKNSLKAKR